MSEFDYRPNVPDETSERLTSGRAYRVRDAGQTVTRVCPETGDDDFWPLEDVGLDPGEGTETGWDYTRTINTGPKTVTRTWTPPPPRSVQEAEDGKMEEADNRWEQAMIDGVPVQVNGDTLQLIYDESARALYAAIPEATSKRPAEGMPVRLFPPGLNGRLTLHVTGDNNYDLVETATFGHRCAGNRAWAAVHNDIEDIKEDDVTYPTDAAKVTAIDAIDVESYAWPSNTVPV